jgi:3-oxoacyl-[acyl-carrier protein] reductase
MTSSSIKQEYDKNSVTPARPLALVTGSSSGIGKAIAVRLACDGFRVVIHYRSDANGAEDTLGRIRAAGGEASVIQFDVAVSSAVERALETLPGLDVLVNNAGIHADGLAGLLSDDAFDRVMKTNAYGAFYLMRQSVRKMIRARQGAIVNVASLAGQTGNPGQINYAASKAALIAMTKTLAMEVGSRGIRVNAVAPGLIETDMIEGIPHLEDFKKRIPLGRFGTTEEVAGAVSFLCSKDAAYITGHTLSVNGGIFPT